MHNQFEIQTKLKLQNIVDLICKKFEAKQISITFKYMEEESLYYAKNNMLILSKDCLENFYYCLALIMKEFIKLDLNAYLRGKLSILLDIFNILSKKKIITSNIKEELINLGFKEVNIGSKEMHQISSKELKFDFFGFDIAIGIFARCISYGCNRLYRALIYNFR